MYKSPYVKFIWELTAWMSLTPHVNSKLRAVDCGWCKVSCLAKAIVPLAEIIIGIIAFVKWLSDESEIFSASLSFAYFLKVLQVLTMTGMFYCGIFGAAFGSRKHWTACFTGMKVVQDGLRKLGKNQGGKWVYAAVGCMLMLSIVAIANGIMEHIRGKVSVMELLDVIKKTYLACNLACYVGNVGFVGKMYKGVNAAMETVGDTRYTSGIKFCDDDFQTNGAIKKIRFIKELYETLQDVVKNINRLYGWSILFFYCYIVLVLLSNLNYFVIVSTKNIFLLDNGELDVYNVFDYVTALAPRLVSLLVVTMISDYASNEANGKKYACYKMQEKFPRDSEERKELLHLAEYYPIDISAAYFFSITRLTLFSIITLLLQYFIVFLQFA